MNLSETMVLCWKMPVRTIGNTFLIVNDIRHIDRSKGSSVWGRNCQRTGCGAAIYTGETSYMDLGNSTGDMVASYKGFKVNIDTYLYQLVWDEETATKILYSILY